MTDFLVFFTERDQKIHLANLQDKKVSEGVGYAKIMYLQVGQVSLDHFALYLHIVHLLEESFFRV